MTTTRVDPTPTIEVRRSPEPTQAEADAAGISLAELTALREWAREQARQAPPLAPELQSELARLFQAPVAPRRTKPQTQR